MTPPAATYIIGDVAPTLELIPERSIDLAVFSPPFLALRSYLPADHPSKPLEHGSEATPAAFLANLIDVTEQLGRVLAPHGSIAVELGDTYSGSGGAGGDYSNPDGLRYGQPRFEGSGSKHSLDAARAGTNSRLAAGRGWPLAKSLCAVPGLYAASLAYGRNLLALPGQPEWREFEPWRVRNLVAWCLDIDTHVYARTPDGDKPMRLLHLHQQFQPGRFQLWDGDRWTPVLGTSATADDNAIEIEFRNGERISCTRGHQWPVTRLPGVVTADELRVGDVVPTVHLPEPDKPRQPQMLPDDDIGWFVGIYLAEGSFDTKGRIQISGHVNETLRASRLARIAAAYDGTCSVYNHDGNTQNVVVRCDTLAAVVHQYLGGSNARNKHLSHSAWRRSNEFLASLLDGYLEGDGHYDAKNERWRLGFTDNPWLARDLRTICARLGYRCRIKRAARAKDPRGGTWAGSARFWHRGEIRFSVSRNLAPSGEVVAIKRSQRRTFIDVGVAGEPHLFALASGLLTHNCRPNPPVGSLADKWRPGTSYVTVATRSARRWWDDIATRRPYKYPDHPQLGKPASGISSLDGGTRMGRRSPERVEHPAGAPLLDWWNITPTGYRSQLGSHYATWPRALVEPLVQAMAPRAVCTTCGTPSRRLTGKPTYVQSRNGNTPATLHWSTCGCPGADGIDDDGYHTGPTWRRGMVLDPYAGTATSLSVALDLGRDALGIDLNPVNAVLAAERIPGLTVTPDRLRADALRHLETEQDRKTAEGALTVTPADDDALETAATIQE